jgi:hypothetical protein
MTPLKQRFRHDPANGVYGDCHRSATASVLDLPLEDVPHFNHDGPDNETFHQRWLAFLADRKLVPINIAFNGDAKLDELLDTVKNLNPGIYYLLGGTSRTGVGHTVVCLDGEIVHDPSLDDSGIVGPLDGHWWVTFFGTADVKAKGGG